MPNLKLPESPLSKPNEQDGHSSFSIPSRRQFLTGLAALGAAALVPTAGSLLEAAGTAAGPQATGAKKRPRRVDVHHHPALPNSGPQVRTTQTGPAPTVWTPQTALAMMDEGGCDLTILSSGGNDGPRCREYNEYMAKLVSDYPGRFGMFTSLPFPDVDGSLKELAYGLDVLKADGVRLSTSYGDKWLGDAAFAPLFEELNRRKAVVYTHPSAPACCAKLVPGVGDATIEFGTDTTRAIVRMVFSGSSARYPDMKMIFSHAGGTMPYLIVRLIKDSAAVPKGFPYEAGRFYYDTAQVAGPGAMFALKNVVPMSQIIFGTDYPYISVKQTAENLKESKVFTAQELAQIDAGNALKLFPKYAV